MTRKLLPALALLVGMHSTHAEPTYPRLAEKAGTLELGAAVLLLMPQKGSQFIDWAHEANGPIVWITDGFKTENWANSDVVTAREGLLRIHVLGKFAHVLKQQKTVLAWTVRYATKSNPKFGVESISLTPGPPGDPCFGTPLFDGCSFDLLPSLKKAGLSVKQLCELKDGQQHIVGYEIGHIKKALTQVVLSEYWGSGGASSSVEIRLASQSKNLCQ